MLPYCAINFCAVFNRDKKSAFAGTYTDATGNDPQGRNRTPGGSARQGNTPNGSGQLSLFGEPASNGESPASPSSPQGSFQFGRVGEEVLDAAILCD